MKISSISNPPNVVINSPPNYYTTNTPTVIVKGRVTDDNGITSIGFDLWYPGPGGGVRSEVWKTFSTAVKDYDFSITIDGLVQGMNKIIIWAWDLDYNRGVSPDLYVIYNPGGTNPPVITITSPPNNYVTSNSNITIEGYITDDTGVAYFGFGWERPDGTSSSSWSPITPSVKRYDFSEPVTLTQTGKHKFTISCQDIDGNYASVTINVTYQPGGPPLKDLIIQPKNGVYLGNFKITSINLPIPFAIVIGPRITVKVDTSTVPGTDHVEFYVEDVFKGTGPILRNTDYNPPYEWVWRESPGLYVLGVKAKDVSGIILGEDYVLVLFV